MKTKYALLYPFLLFPFLLISQFQAPYIFYTTNGDSLEAKQLLVAVTKNKQVKAFNVEGTMLAIDEVSAFSTGDKYYRLIGYDKKGDLNLFKRYWRNDKMELFYQNNMKVVSFPWIEIQSTKNLFYRKNDGALTLLNYKNMNNDLVATSNKNLAQLFSKINGIRNRKKLSIWLGVGAVFYTAHLLEKNGKITPSSFLPALLFGYTSYAGHKEKRLLEEAVKIY